ncbi:MAG TPA: hypothetical protein V6C88_14380 [Chroococcidiopsis sp.]
MGDALDLARQAADENRYWQAQRAAARQQAEDKMPGPTTYEGYDAGSARAIVRSLGNTPVQSGEVITNGGVKVGQRVDASASPGRVAIDAMPRVKPQPQPPAPQSRPRAKFAFLYSAVIENAVSSFMGGFLSRLRIVPAFKDLPKQIHFLRNKAIGGCKLEFDFIQIPRVDTYPLPDLPSGAFPPQGIVKIEGNKASIFYKDEFFRAQPIGYGLWLSVIDDNFIYHGSRLFGSVQLEQYKTAQPYLTMSASARLEYFGPIDPYTIGSFSGSGTAKSILIDSLAELVETADISWQSSGGSNSKSETADTTCSASGETIILPGIKRPFSASMSGRLIYPSVSETQKNNLYGTVMVDCTRSQSITWHKNGIWDTGDANWYLFQGEDQTRLDSSPHLNFELTESERRIPEIGTYTLSGKSFFKIGTLRTGSNGEKEPDLAFKNAIAGMPIIWSVKTGDRACRRAYGRIVGLRFEASTEFFGDTKENITSLTISIERVADLPYCFGATPNGTIASNSGSVLDFLWAMGVDVGNGSSSLGPGFQPSFQKAVFPSYSARIALTHTNYHWQGNTIYIPENPPSSPAVNADNYAAVWKIVDGKFFLQDQVKKARRIKLLKEGETFQDAIAGTYHP